VAGLVLGFTGTRQRPTLAQLAVLDEELAKLTKLGFLQLLHGDCVGADAAAHRAAHSIGWKIEIFPPNEPTYRAYCLGADTIHTTRAYMARNELIAARCDRLLALPETRTFNKRRSGTWATVRRAWKRDRPVTIIWPDGKVEVNVKEKEDK
jgi:hypothetical protein